MRYWYIYDQETPKLGGGCTFWPVLRFITYIWILDFYTHLNEEVPAPELFPEFFVISCLPSAAASSHANANAP